MTEPIYVAESGTPEWLEARNTGIGASEIWACTNKHPYETALSIYLRKRGELGPVEETKHMRIGRKLEPVIKDEYCIDTGSELLMPNPPMYRHPELPHIFATPDALVTPTLGLECKSTSWRMKSEYGDELTDDAPLHYVAQCQAQMAVMGFDEVHLAVMFDGIDLKIFKVLRNDQLIKLLLGAATELWERIQEGNPPEPDWKHPSTPKLIRAMHQEIRDTRIMLSDEEASLWSYYERLGKLAKKIEERRAEVRARIEHVIGNNFAGVLPDGRMIRRKVIGAQGYVVSKDSHIDVRAVKYDGGNIVDRETPQLVEGD